ncbi:hypothetical protein ACWD48_33750 [Streptomyces sp. NPDC002519]
MNAALITAAVTTVVAVLGAQGQQMAVNEGEAGTTLGALRQEHADYRAAQEASVLGLDDLDDREPDTVVVLADW